MTNDDDEYDDFFKMIKKYLGINSDMFDVDFLFLPEPTSDPKNKNSTGFKVTYHFEAGMDKPEVRIEGDFDERKLQDYLKRINYSKYPNFKHLTNQIKKKQIDVKELRLDSAKSADDLSSIEPFSELIECPDHFKIIIEAPGVEKGHFLLSLSEDGKSLNINAESEFRRFLKNIKLPLKCTLENYKLAMKNGIITLKLNKLDSERG
ncbi:MAG: Hsp20/alpha crystallin family protein [Candidatus Heimdallarchaeota archaeon]